jgi:DNA-binding MarR family transcriptional regulator
MPADVKLSHHLGYLLRRLDSLIEATQERTLAEEHLTRRQLQILHILSESPQDAAALTDKLRPFLGPDKTTVDEATDELSRRGWLIRDETGRFELTPAGQTGCAAGEAKLNDVLRSTFLAGLTPDDYYGTLRVLRQMTENLERASGQDARTATDGSEPLPHV